MSQVIQVISKEGLSVDFTPEVASTSTYLQTVLKDDPNATEIITNLPYEALVIAQKFLSYHLTKPMAAIPKPLKDYQNFRNNIEDVFDSDLVCKLNRDATFDLLYTAQVLQNESLVALWYGICVWIWNITASAAYTASLINGKSVAELRDFFQVEDDLTEEEKVQIDKENACFRI